MLRVLVWLFAFLPGLPALAQSALPAGNAGTGKLVFLQCQACHEVAAGGPTLVGPDLFGIYGRKAGTLPGYQYSTALKDSGIVWTAATLNPWLADPSALVPGTKMAFAGLASPALRTDIIAYLETLK